MKLRNKLILIAAGVVFVVYTALATTFQVYAVFGSAAGTESCSGRAYNGYANYIKAAPAWGWKFDTNSATHTVSVATNATIYYTSRVGEWGCGVGTVNVVLANPQFPVRFTVYWPTTNGTPPAGGYPITLDGFLP
jgi:hypothetical protein